MVFPLIMAVKIAGIGLSIAVASCLGVALTDGIANAASIVNHVQPNQPVEQGWEIKARQTKQATQSQFTSDIGNRSNTKL
jgi:hypothetical protein